MLEQLDNIVVTKNNYKFQLDEHIFEDISDTPIYPVLVVASLYQAL